jgi:hypothetical protein
MDEILPILDEFTRRGQDGFTFTTDLRHRERMSGGADSPDYVGVRLQYVPEIRMRFDEDFRNAVVNDPQVLQDDLKSALRNMQNAINALDRSGAKIVDARVHHYDTLAVGKESYDDFLKGIADLENASSEYERSARGTNPVARFGRPISSHVEGRDRALRAGYGQAAPDASTAVEQPNLGITEPNKSRGGSAFASGGRSLGNNALGNALRMARLSNDEIEMPRSLKELQAIKKLRPAKNTDMDSMFTSRMSGIEGAEPVAMPADLNELLAYLRTRHSSGGRSHYDDGGDVRGGDSPFMSRADYGLGSANARSDEAPSFRQAEDRSMEAYNRAVESGWSPTGGDGGGGWGSSVPSVPSEGMMGRGLPAETPKTDVSPFGFGRRDVVFGQDFLGQAPQNIRQWTQQRLDTVPENIYEAAKDPSLYYGMGYPGVVGKQPSRAGVAGLLGTLYGESTYDPTAINPESGAVGMAQYLGSRKQDFLRAMGINEKKPTDAQLEQALAGTAIPQMGYIINEMLTQPGYRPSSNQYLTGTNPSRVTDVLTRNFERPSEKEIAESSARRAAEARSIYAGETVPTAPSDPIKEALLSRVGLPADRSGYQRVASNLRPDSMGTTTDVTEDTDQVSVDTSSADKSNDIYRNLMDMPGFGSEDPAQIAAYNQAVSKALGYATGPQSVYNVFAAGQRTPQTDTFGGKLSGILEDAFSPKFVGVNDPNYAKMIQQKDDFNRPVQEGGGGRDAADILAARAAAAPAGSQAALAPYLTELSSGNLALPHVDGLTAQQWANANTGGDLSKVHARIVYRNGAPRLEYYAM